MHESRFVEFLSWEHGAGAVLFFLAVWATICLTVSCWSGWHLLAERFRSEREFAGELSRFQSGRMRWGCGYNNALTLGANADGLYMATLAIIRLGHPPLFIPWMEITARNEKRLWADGVQFTLGLETKIQLWVLKSVGEKLLARRAGEYTMRA